MKASLLLGLVLGTWAVGAIGEEFTLVHGAQPACTIVTAPDAGPAARLAAAELQFHVLKITGALLPLTTDAMAPGPRILVGDSPAAAALGYSGSALAEQEYIIAFRPDTLVILGNDEKSKDLASEQYGRTTTGETLASLRHRIDYWATVGMPDRSAGEMDLPGLFDAQATCYAVYDFLERYCGVRWYGPGAISQVVPQSPDLVVRGEDIRRKPALAHRSAMSRGGWPFVKGQWGPCSDPEIYLFWRRMRLGGERWAANHTIHQQTIRDLLNDPAYQAQGLAQGKNLCYTNPLLVEKIAQLARDYFDGKGELPEGFKAMGNYFALVPEDVSLYCRCNKCRALLKQGRDRRTGFFSSGLISNYWFSFVNAVARELRKTHPDKYIATLAYWEYAYPPVGFTLEPNVSIAP
ncbi:MAG: DUF4838 domain-containing protein, partial [Candidatus Hydrogenedentes bacterium]|nr:DUF4838 domain-containing protein [Candidatus Hydrogenedentota bacterium]